VGTLFHRHTLRERGIPEGEPDAALVARSQRDRHAFGALYDRYFDAVYRYCYVRLGSAERAEDAAHQVFVRVLEGVGRYQESGRFRSWLFTIAHSVVVNELAPRPQRIANEGMEYVMDPAAGPEAEAVAAVELQRVRAALAQLPPDQRQAIELRLAGLTGREIARELGRSQEAVKMLQQRGLTRLRTHLGVTTAMDMRHDA
jgi:RNA polymerase sigma-70 factor (ECF subfamily)